MAARATPTSSITTCLPPRLLTLLLAAGVFGSIAYPTARADDTMTRAIRLVMEEWPALEILIQPV